MIWPSWRFTLRSHPVNYLSTISEQRADRDYGWLPSANRSRNSLITSVLPPDRGESLCISLWTDRASVRPRPQ